MAWGMCKSCKWWQVEPDANAENATMGMCAEEKLQPFTLRVSGNSGCSRFREGEPQRSAGASEVPDS